MLSYGLSTLVFIEAHCFIGHFSVVKVQLHFSEGFHKQHMHMIAGRFATARPGVQDVEFLAFSYPTWRLSSYPSGVSAQKVRIDIHAQSGGTDGEYLNYAEAKIPHFS